MWLPTDVDDISDRENCVTLFNEVGDAAISVHNSRISARSCASLLSFCSQKNCRLVFVPHHTGRWSRFTSMGRREIVESCGSVFSHALREDVSHGDD